MTSAMAINVIYNRSWRQIKSDFMKFAFWHMLTISTILQSWCEINDRQLHFKKTCWTIEIWNPAFFLKNRLEIWGVFQSPKKQSAWTNVHGGKLGEIRVIFLPWDISSSKIVLPMSFVFQPALIYCNPYYPIQCLSCGSFFYITHSTRSRYPPVVSQPPTFPPLKLCYPAIARCHPGRRHTGHQEIMHKSV